jgi:hypothetical protein
MECSACQITASPAVESEEADNVGFVIVEVIESGFDYITLEEPNTETRTTKEGSTDEGWLQQQPTLEP